MKDFSEYILWTQSSSTSEKDILLVDGKYLSSEDGDGYFSYMSLISDGLAPRWKPLYENNNSKLFVEGKGLSRSFSIYQNSEGCTLIKSLYLEQDETGRKMAYLFCCHTQNLQDVIISLMNASSSIGRSLNKADMSMINVLRYKKYLPCFGLIFLLLILLLTFVLWTVLK